MDVDSGRVSHPLLDRDWKPVLSINTVIFGLQLLFLEPNPDHAANGDAATTLHSAPSTFAAHVKQTMRGGLWHGLDFPPHRPMRQKKRERDENSTVDVGNASASDAATNDADAECASAMEVCALGGVHSKRPCFDSRLNGSQQTRSSYAQPPLTLPNQPVRHFPVAPNNYPISLVPVEQPNHSQYGQRPSI